jgi:hypothetical protein
MVDDNDIPFHTEAEWRGILYKFFQRQGIELVAATKEFDEFRDQAARFAHENTILKFIEDPAVFWQQAAAFAPNISMSIAYYTQCTTLTAYSGGYQVLSPCD